MEVNDELITQVYLYIGWCPGHLQISLSYLQCSVSSGKSKDKDNAETQSTLSWPLQCPRVSSFAVSNTAQMTKGDILYVFYLIIN